MAIKIKKKEEAGARGFMLSRNNPLTVVMNNLQLGWGYSNCLVL